MSLDTIVKVTISRQTKTPTRAGFGQGAYVSEGAVFAGLIKSYADIDEINVDVASGLLDTAAQVAAQRYFGQENAPPLLYIIKKGQDLVKIQLITFAGAFVTANSISIQVDAAAVVTPFNTDSDTTLGDIATNIAAEAGVSTAVANTAARTILVTGAVVNTDVSLSALTITGGASQTTGTIALVQEFDEVQTYTQSIQRAQVVNDSWYGLSIESKALTDQEAVADFVAPLTKLFFYSTSASEAIDPADSTDIFSLLKAKAYDRSIGLYSGDAANHPAVGWKGGQFPKDPGSITWDYQTIQGAVVDSTLSTTAQNSVLGKNGNTYTDVAGNNVTQEGKVASGEYIDVIRGIDWITARMQEGIFALKVNQDKIPYTDKGIASIEGEMRVVLDLAVTRNVLSEYTITVPLAADIPTADKAARILKNMKFNGKLAGAIHKTEIQGTITL